MGCAMCKKGDGSGTDKRDGKKKGYSWDKRDKVDGKNLTVENLKGQTIGKLPGQVCGQQFIIQNCENCNIYIYDHSASVTVDDCTNCKIFLGPVKSSVFIRDCKGCSVVVACQQFRARDCHKLDIFLHCVTQPIIESSSAVRVACYQYHYEQLEEQFKAADLSLFNNHWSKVHDFTPVTGEENWSLLPPDARVEEYVPLPNSDKFKDMKLSTHPKDSLVPLSLGSRKTRADSNCLVVFFCDGLHVERAQGYIDEMSLNHVGCQLVRSAEFTMQETDADRVFQNEAYTSQVKKGPVIGLEYSGADIIAACKEGIVNIATGATGLVYLSSHPNTSSSITQQFFSLADAALAT